MTPRRTYPPEEVERVARALYSAASAERAEKTVPWPSFKRYAETDATTALILSNWYAIAIAALDLSHGIRTRL